MPSLRMALGGVTLQLDTATGAVTLLPSDSGGGERKRGREGDPQQ